MADLGRAALKKASSGSETAQQRRQSSASNGVHPRRAASARSESQPIVAGNIPAPAAAVNFSTTTTSQTPAGISTIGDNLTSTIGLDPTISPDWLNFDTAFENFDAVLGSSGADVSMDLLRPFHFDDFGLEEPTR